MMDFAFALFGIYLSGVQNSVWVFYIEDYTTRLYDLIWGLQ